MPEQEDFLAHYGKKGMKWGKRKAAREEKNAAIDQARGNQAARKAEIRALTEKRIKARTQKGKQKIDAKIADKEFALKNNDDARTAAQLKTGEKVMKGVKITALLGLSVVGLGAAASIVNQELNAMNNKDNFPMSLKEYDVNSKLNNGEKVSLRELGEAEAATARIRNQ